MAHPQHCAVIFRLAFVRRLANHKLTTLNFASSVIVALRALDSYTLSQQFSSDGRKHSTTTGTLLEVSMVEKPADKFAVARPISHEARRIRRRMQAQQRSLDRDDDDDGLLLRAIMPSSRQILHGSPELIEVRQAEDRRLVFYGD